MTFDTALYLLIIAWSVVAAMVVTAVLLGAIVFVKVLKEVL